MSEFRNELQNALAAYESAKHSYFTWRFEATFAHKLTLALGFACLTGLLAQMRFYLPFTPVPVTGQVFAVLLSGVVLGTWYGGMSQGFYAGIGAAGIPWFAGAKGGVDVLTGVTGGYLMGFIAASLIIGWFADRYAGGRRVEGMAVLMAAGIAVIYLFGALQLSLVLGVGARKAIELGVLPFIGVDEYKALTAAAIAKAVLPGALYGNEMEPR